MEKIIRKASVRLKGGYRTIASGSEILKQTRQSLKIVHNTGDADIESADILAAAYASSFSLALSNELSFGRIISGEITTHASVTLTLLAVGWTISNINLNVVAKLPEVTQSHFIDATVRAKINCLGSRTIRSNVTMRAKLSPC